MCKVPRLASGPTWPPIILSLHDFQTWVYCNFLLYDFQTRVKAFSLQIFLFLS
jgi:hypothetical protein